VDRTGRIVAVALTAFSFYLSAWFFQEAKYHKGDGELPVLDRRGEISDSQTVDERSYRRSVLTIGWSALVVGVLCGIGVALEGSKSTQAP